MSRTINRRHALLGTVALPAALAPLGLAQAVTPNATDQAWAALQAARSAYEANEAAYDAWEAANVPERLHRPNSPDWADYDDEREWRAAVDAWRQERDAYVNPHDPDDDQLDALCGPINEAQAGILDTPAATVTDVERKLSVVSDLARENMIDADWIEGVLVDVKRINGRAA